MSEEVINTDYDYMPTGWPYDEIPPEEVSYINWNYFDFTPQPYNSDEVDRLEPLANTMVCGGCGAIMAVAKPPFSKFSTIDTGWQCPDKECSAYWISTDELALVKSKNGQMVILMWYNEYRHPNT